MTLREGGSPLVEEDWSMQYIYRADGRRMQVTLQGITLDMNYFYYHGVYYYMWSQRLMGATSTADIYIATFDPTDPHRLTSDEIIIARPSFSWERNDAARVLEGTYALWNPAGDRLFVTYSGGMIDATYCVGLMEAKQPEDFVASNGLPANLLNPDNWIITGRPILSSTAVPGQIGPGHNAYTRDEFGRDVFVYHAIDATDMTGRHSGLRTVYWSYDGTPVLYQTPEMQVRPENRNIEITVNVIGEFPDPGAPDEFYFDTYWSGMNVLEPGEGLVATTYFSSAVPGATLDAVALLALFDGSDRLIAIDRNVFGGAGSGIASVSLQLPEALPSGANAKLFIWDANYEPLTEAVPFIPDEDALPNPIVWYDFNQTGSVADGTQIPDISGNGNHGRLNSGTTGTAQWTGDALVITNTATTAAGTGRWANAPQGLLNGIDTFTVSLYVRQNVQAGSADRFTWSVHPDPSAAGALAYNYLMLNNVGRQKLAITTNSWMGEQGFSIPRSNLNVWEHYILVITPTTLTMYRDGDLVSSVAVTARLSDLGNNLNIDFGRSPFGSDLLFNGAYGDFRIFEGELTAGQIERLSNEFLHPVDDNAIFEDWEALVPTQNGEPMPSGNLQASLDSLPLIGPNGSLIEWRTTNPAVLTSRGRVIEPQEAVEVNLVAIITNGDSRLTRVFPFNVLPGAG